MAHREPPPSGVRVIELSIAGPAGTTTHGLDAEARAQLRADGAFGDPAA